jgi:hypothetical protein
MRNWISTEQNIYNTRAYFNARRSVTEINIGTAEGRLDSGWISQPEIAVT